MEYVSTVFDPPGYVAEVDRWRLSIERELDRDQKGMLPRPIKTTINHHHPLAFQTSCLP
jgi:hypothetical protein